MFTICFTYTGALLPQGDKNIEKTRVTLPFFYVLLVSPAVLNWHSEVWLAGWKEGKIEKRKQEPKTLHSPGTLLCSFLRCWMSVLQSIQNVNVTSFYFLLLFKLCTLPQICLHSTLSLSFEAPIAVSENPFVLYVVLFGFCFPSDCQGHGWRAWSCHIKLCVWCMSILKKYCFNKWRKLKKNVKNFLHWWGSKANTRKFSLFFFGFFFF